ncbi:Tetracycline resistance protein [Serinicoccus hydrothermalis]|uniref:Tetracycline resistance protein n=1 Tax=Serinicoccus hydrothermalis TaxID=1758689 RepID=A0A1B1NBJ5_9MICO|nr:MFS transporter [Serinicoccus hydrothermalis]ANS78781.1 Tetracycline resistance protein [Serinicoccus hydrothermalis]
MTADHALDATDTAQLQSRTVLTLMGSQTLGGIGVASGIAVGAIVAADVSGRDALSGLATTTQVLGGALFTIPIAALMGRRGRRVGLSAAYVVGALGAALAIAATATGTFWMLLVGTTLFGASTTANSQARYAATDLAAPERRGRQLSWVVWATTIGSVLGPNMVGPGKAVAGVLGLPPLAGAWVFSAIGFGLAAVLLQLALRPDPLLTARRLAGVDTEQPVGRQGNVGDGLRLIRATPAALWGTAALTVGHVVMVAVMVMTPLHMRHGEAEIELIGLVISLHILGMYGLAPVTGQLTDRFGPRPVVLLGTVLLVLACLLAGISHDGFSPGLTAGLFLLGLGWSCTMVAGSGTVAGAVPVGQRASVQGGADLVMGLSAAAGGALAGVVMDLVGYAWLCVLAALAAVVLAAYTTSVVSLRR